MNLDFTLLQVHSHHLDLTLVTQNFQVPFHYVLFLIPVFILFIAVFLLLTIGRIHQTCMCVCVCVCVCVCWKFSGMGGVLFFSHLVVKLYLTLLWPHDYSLWGFSIHVIFQVRILDRIVISYSRGSSWPRDWTPVSPALAGRFFTIGTSLEVLNLVRSQDDT